MDKQVKKSTVFMIFAFTFIFCLVFYNAIVNEDEDLIDIKAARISNLEVENQKLTNELEMYKAQLEKYKSTTEKMENTVYITRTGSKYHKSSCSYLRQSKISINLSNAIRQGYTACSRCNP